MYIKLLQDFLVILQTVQLGALCPTNTCLTGVFFFAPGRHMVNNHTLHGHVFDNFAVTKPVECFRKCRCDCRCISFNYLPHVIKNNCELNEENRHTNSSALKPLQGSQYYDLVFNYDLRVRNLFHCSLPPSLEAKINKTGLAFLSQILTLSAFNHVYITCSVASWKIRNPRSL